MIPTTRERYYKMVNKYCPGPEHNNYYVIMEALAIALTFIKEEDAGKLIRVTEKKLKL